MKKITILDIYNPLNNIKFTKVETVKKINHFIVYTLNINNYLKYLQFT